MNNPPAFPHAAAFQGMSLRDYFAAKAMQGGIDILHTSRFSTKDELAVWCYEWADAMLKAREA